MVCQYVPTINKTLRNVMFISLLISKPKGMTFSHACLFSYVVFDNQNSRSHVVISENKATMIIKPSQNDGFLTHMAWRADLFLFSNGIRLA